MHWIAASALIVLVALLSYREHVEETADEERM
jgi:hypothetical protein